MQRVCQWRGNEKMAVKTRKLTAIMAKTPFF
jgi:hypothetical protein